MAIKTKLEDLLEAINDVTGEERTNLTDAIQDLVDGQGETPFAYSIPIKTGPVHLFNPTNVYITMEVEENANS